MLIKLFLLLLIANGIPVLVGKLLARRCAWPVDGGRVLADGCRVFGHSKTWRGIVFSVLFTGVFSLMLGFSFVTGVIIGAGAMTGDLFSSFIKRRLKMPPSSMAMGLDQIPESLLPLILIAPVTGLAIGDIILLVLIFFIFELVLSKILFHLNIRKNPY